MSQPQKSSSRRSAKKSETEIQWVIGENPNKDVIVRTEKPLDFVDVAWLNKVQEFSQSITNTGKSQQQLMLWLLFFCEHLLTDISAFFPPSLSLSFLFLYPLRVSSATLILEGQLQTRAPIQSSTSTTPSLTTVQSEIAAKAKVLRKMVRKFLSLDRRHDDTDITRRDTKYIDSENRNKSGNDSSKQPDVCMLTVIMLSKINRKVKLEKKAMIQRPKSQQTQQQQTLGKPKVYIIILY